MKDLRSGIEYLKQAKAHMSKANGIMSDYVSKFKALEEENAQLKAELGSLQIQPDASYVKLPLDADGVPIRIGDVVYGNPGIAWTVVCLRMSELGCKVQMENMPFLCNPDDLSHKKPEPADSWEKLEEDAKQQSCWYFGLDRPPCVMRRLSAQSEADRPRMLAERPPRHSGSRQEARGHRRA